MHAVGPELGEQPRVVRDREHAEVVAPASSRSTRRATSRSASTSRPESISSRTANFGCEHRELHGLGALLLAAGELVVDAAGRGARRARRARAPRRATRVVQTGRVDAARAHRRAPTSVSSGTPGTSTGYCIARNSPRCGALPRGQPEQLLAVDRDRTGGHLVVAAPHQRVRERRLPRSVRAHERVHLARAHLEVDAAQDLVAGDAYACRSADRSASLTAPPPSRRRRRPRTSYTGTGCVAGSVCGSPVAQRERRAVLRALDLALVLPHVALGERVVGVRARVADRVEVVADAHDRDAVPVDVEAAARCRARGRRARTGARASPIIASPARCSSLSTTERAQAARRARRPAGARTRRRRSRARSAARPPRAGCPRLSR